MLEVRTANACNRFDYDGDVVYGLRKTTRFFESAVDPRSIPQALDCRDFIIERNLTEIKLTVRSEGRLLEWNVHNAKIILDRTFLNLYDEDR
jgi:hypothetical protein